MNLKELVPHLIAPEILLQRRLGCMRRRSPFGIYRALMMNQFILFLVLTMVTGLVLLLRKPLTEFMDSDQMSTMFSPLTMFNESTKELHPEQLLDPVLIFTCLGSSGFTKHQIYIWKSISQARVINPKIRIVLILSKHAFDSSIAQKLRYLNVTPEINDDITFDDPLIQDFHRFFFVETLMEPGGNKQFVQFTLERLFSIHAYMKRNTQIPVFHIENDNMLYVNLRKLSKRMDECGVNLAVPKAAMNQAVVSFIYIRNAHVLEQFIKWCIRVFQLGRPNAIKFLNTSFINDMTLTARYLELRGSTDKQSKLSGVYELPTRFTDELQECCLCFLDNGPIIFDACVLGQYFGGTYAKPNASHWEPTRLLDPRGETLSWRSLNSKIRVPFIRNQRIANIHVHSKRLEDFSSLGNRQTTGFSNITS